MANDCLAQIQVCRMRAARLEPNGVPDPGADNLYVSDTLAILTFSPEMEEGDEFIRKNGCGDLCVNYKDRDRYKRFNIELELCVPDPELSELLAGGVVLQDGAAVGYGYPRLATDATPNGISLEVWAKRIDTAGALDATFPYAWWVFPRVYLRHDEKAFENAPQNTKLVGYAIENENWYDGPLNDWPVDSDRAVQWIPTAIMPAASCGFATIVAS